MSAVGICPKVVDWGDGVCLQKTGVDAEDGNVGIHVFHNETRHHVTSNGELANVKPVSIRNVAQALLNLTTSLHQ